MAASSGTSVAHTAHRTNASSESIDISGVNRDPRIAVPALLQYQRNASGFDGRQPLR
jgi:hypothetical protein